MIRVFLDANVLFTASHNPNGKASLLIEMSAKQRWILLSSEYAVQEARRNLSRKFPHGLAGLEKLLGTIRIVAPPPGQVCPVRLPAKDQPIFLAAMAGQASHLLTGDWKDFGASMDNPQATCGIIVQTVAAFLLKV